MPPNVLAVVLDAARADAFEPYGAEPGSTPAVAQLAGRGTAVPAAYSGASWTLPSHASMFTGQFARAMGLGQAPGKGPSSSAPVIRAHRDRFLPEVLRRNGYATGGVSANLWLTEDSGFGTGFDEFEYIPTTRHANIGRKGLRRRAAWLAEGVRARADDGAGRVAETLRAWVDAPPRQPFFWFVNVIECHSPYLPPRPYNDLSPIGRARAAADASRHLTLDGIWGTCLGGPPVPDGALARMRHLYRRSVRLLDDWLAGVLEALDAARLLDDTLVIVTSDHGENLGEAGLIGHAFSLDERLIRVPFVAAGPVRMPDPELLSLVRLPRLLADLLELRSHPWTEEEPVPGVAVAQFDPVMAPHDPRAHKAAEDWGIGEEGLRRFTTPLTCATDGRRKLLLRGDVEELYDLERDPHEHSPLAPAEVPVLEPAIAPLRKALEHPAVWARPQERRAAPDADEVEELEAQMRLLGYL